MLITRHIIINNKQETISLSHKEWAQAFIIALRENISVSDLFTRVDFLKKNLDITSAIKVLLECYSNGLVKECLKNRSDNTKKERFIKKFTQ